MLSLICHLSFLRQSTLMEWSEATRSREQPFRNQRLTGKMQMSVEGENIIRDETILSYYLPACIT